MKEVEIGGRRVELYDSIEGLPIVRFTAFCKMLLIDSGVGSDLSAVDRHVERVIRFMRNGKPDEAERELRNMRQSVWMVQEGLCPRHLAFAALVRSVDGVGQTDVSEAGLRKVAAMLGDATEKEVSSAMEEAKKKIDAELEVYFPALFDDAEAKEFYDLLAARTRRLLALVGGRGDAEGLERITDEVLTFYAPREFGGTKGVEVTFDKDFNRMCVVMSCELGTRPKEETVLEYYSAYEWLREKTKRTNNTKRYGKLR